MQPLIKVAVCQLPDISENVKSSLAWIQQIISQAEAEAVSLICFPECFLQGYLTDEMQAKKHAIDISSETFNVILDKLAPFEPMIVFGMIEEENGSLYNSAVVIHKGKLVGKYRKTELLEGERIFTAGTEFPVFEIDQLKFGINICYDTQFPEASKRLTEQGATMILCLSNTMMSEKKANQFKYLHCSMRAERAKENKVWLLSSDITGEKDGRIAYGSTSVIDPGGNILQQVPFLETGMLTVEI